MKDSASLSGNSTGHCPEGLVILLDIIAQSRDPFFDIGHGRFAMRHRDHAAKFIGQRGIDVPVIGKAIERRILVEPLHLQRPFHRLAIAAKRQPAGAISR